MAKGKCPDCPKCLPGWLVQFGDLMSLLLCFFILLLSMATMDKKKVEEYFEIMRRSMGFLEGAEDTAAASKQSLAAAHVGMSGDGATESDSTSDNTQEVQDVVQEFNNTNQEDYQDIQLSVKNNNEFTLDIPSSLMFNEGEYNINNTKSKQFIAKLARIVRTMPQNFDIEVMGYAGRNVKNNDIPRDSWDISALRSIAVVKELIKNKIEPSSLKVAAYGSYRPKSDAMSENRRVELKFVASKNESKIIDQANFFDRIKE